MFPFEGILLDSVWLCDYFIYVYPEEVKLCINFMFSSRITKFYTKTGVLILKNIINFWENQVVLLINDLFRDKNSPWKIKVTDIAIETTNLL